uniref:Glutaredoxin domain-containing protein n=1 Tax=Leersia perrieri TaxID=77586 RepID=A0A0D9VL14_9ORYZ
MGCTGSRHAFRGGVKGSKSAYARTRSGPAAVHHTVSLKSSTLGSLSLDRDRDEEMMKWRDDGAAGAKTTPPPPLPPQMARRQRQLLAPAAKTPVREPEVINVWELMEGLDDKDGEERGEKGLEEHQSKPGSPEFDPDIIAAFRKALDEVPPAGDEVCVRKREIQRFPGIVRERVSAFQKRIDAKLAKMAPPRPPSPPPEPEQEQPPPPPDSARKVVLYLTSLRGIRKTYEDCWATKAILQGYGVLVDERDLSMHAGFKEELHAALRSPGSLPQVFADGRHLGGAEEVRRMHESGELSKALGGCDTAPPAAAGKGISLDACSGCGGVRFVPCEECSGSCKVFLEELDTFRRCPDCNENGLVRCPLC